jgi:hypothetical protein
MPLPSLPGVAAWSLAGRAAAYTAAWTCYALALQFAIEGTGRLLRRAGLRKTTRPPQHGAAKMLAVECLGYASWLCGIGLLQVGDRLSGIPSRLPERGRWCGACVAARSAGWGAASRGPCWPHVRPHGGRPPPRPAIARLQAWVNPGWGDWSYAANPVLLFWYQVDRAWGGFAERAPARRLDPRAVCGRRSVGIYTHHRCGSKTAVWQVPYMMLYDTFFFFLHRASHR